MESRVGGQSQKSTNERAGKRAEQVKALLPRQERTGFHCPTQDNCHVLSFFRKCLSNLKTNQPNNQTNTQLFSKTKDTSHQSTDLEGSGTYASTP